MNKYLASWGIEDTLADYLAKKDRLVPKTHMIVETIDRSLLRDRVFAILSAFSGGFALLLAAIHDSARIGLYGLMAF